MKTRKIIAVICVITLFFSLSLPISANSAQRYWSGTDSTGAIITGDSSPIVVERELLTFDIAEFPQNYYNDEESFLAYTGRVTAEYTFHNPSDIEVTATLAFPFGIMPDYGYDFSDLDKYGVQINGQDAEVTIRHTLSYPYSQFYPETDIPRLSDDYISEGIYSPDTTVTLYKWTVSGIYDGKYTAANIALDIPKTDEDRVYYLVDQSGGHVQGSGDLRISCWVNNKSEAPAVYLYVFGKPLDTLPTWKFYQDGGVEDGEEIGGQASFAGSESMTLLEFALENYDAQGGVSEIDWYNAVVSDLLDSGNVRDYPIVSPYGYSSGYQGYLMRWYQYEITLAPGAKLTNTVTAPMYPDIDGGYSSSVYTYNYLLSPASTWADFGGLDIVINTPYYMTECSLSGFEETEGGYKISLEGLPKDADGKHVDLTFDLCAEENPQKTAAGFGWTLLGILLIIISPFLYLFEALESVFDWFVSLFK